MIPKMSESPVCASYSIENWKLIAILVSKHAAASLLKQTNNDASTHLQPPTRTAPPRTSVHPGHVGTNIAINSRAPEMLPKDSAEVNKRRKLVGWVTGEDLSRLSRGELEKRMRENFRD